MGKTAHLHTFTSEKACGHSFILDGFFLPLFNRQQLKMNATYSHIHTLMDVSYCASLVFWTL